MATVATLDNLDVRAVTDQEDHELVVNQAWQLLAASRRPTAPTQVAFAGDIAHPTPGRVYAIGAGAMQPS